MLEGLQRRRNVQMESLRVREIRGAYDLVSIGMCIGVGFNKKVGSGFAKFWAKLR